MTESAIPTPTKGVSPGRNATEVEPGVARGRRLKAARIQARYKTVEELARAMKVVPTTLYQHESGTRPLTVKAAEMYAPYLGVSSAYLLVGETGEVPHVPVKGVVGADGIVLKTRANTTEKIAAPPKEDAARLAAFRINDERLWPTYHIGDHIFYDEAVFADRPDARIIDKHECIVQPSTGKADVFIVNIVKHSDGVSGFLIANLQRHKGAPVSGASIRHAAPVLWVKRNTTPIE